MILKKIWKNIQKKFNFWLYGESYFQYSCDLSCRDFGDIKRYFENLKTNIDENKNSHLEIYKEDDDIFTIFYVYKGEDKYGDPIYLINQYGLYNGKEEKLYYLEDLKKYIDNKYFKNESKED